MIKKIYFLLLIASLCFSEKTFAQMQNEKNTLVFSQLSIDDKRVTFNNWMNESTSVTMPNNVLTDLKTYYAEQKTPASIILKTQHVLKPLYNINLSKQNKLDVCDYIANIYDEYFIPKAILNKIKQSL